MIEKNNGKIISPVSRSPYIKSEGEIIVWGQGGGGFCFFLKKKEAIRANDLHSWLRGSDARQIVVKICYFEGIGKHIETKFLGSYEFEVALCKKFRFVK